jgi:hypothetical protein
MKQHIPVVTWNKLVEAAGIEPASRKEDPKEPTCLVSVLVSDGGTLADRFSAIPAYCTSPFFIGFEKGYPASMTPFRTKNGRKVRTTWLH